MDDDEEEEDFFDEEEEQEDDDQGAGSEEEEEVFDEDDEEELLAEEDLEIGPGYTAAFNEGSIGFFMDMVIFHGDSATIGRVKYFLVAEINGGLYRKHQVVKIKGETGVFVVQRFGLNEGLESSWVDVYGGRQLYHSSRSFSIDRITGHVPNPPRVMFKWDFDEKPKKAVTTRVR